MKKSIYYIGLDVHKETVAVVTSESSARRTDILAVLARLRRKVKEILLLGNPGRRSQTRFALGYFLSPLRGFKMACGSFLVCERRSSRAEDRMGKEFFPRRAFVS